MSVIDGAFCSPMGHVGLQWFSDKAYRSPMKHLKVSDGYSIRHVGLQWVSDNNHSVDNNHIFVNSYQTFISVI